MRPDRCGEAYCRFTQFCERPYKEMRWCGYCEYDKFVILNFVHCMIRVSQADLNVMTTVY